MLSSQRALPLVDTEMLREREGMHLVLLSSIGVKYILIPVALLLPKIEGKKNYGSKTKRVFAQNLPTAAGRRGSKQGSFTHRKRAVTPMAMDYLSPNSANPTYSTRERSVCVDEGGIWPYTSLGKKTGCYHHFSLPSP